MQADLYCGHCDSAMQLDNSNDEGEPIEVSDSALWYVLLRFINAHADHGFATPDALVASDGDKGSSHP